MFPRLATGTAIGSKRRSLKTSAIAGLVNRNMHFDQLGLGRGISFQSYPRNRASDFESVSPKIG
jgi:hypothetical protein